MRSQCLLSVVLILCCAGGVRSQTYTKTRKIQNPDQSPALTPEEMYRDMFVLTRDNFTDTVLRHQDPWIVLFHDGSLDKAWKTMATNMRGICWIGIIDVTINKQLLDDLIYRRLKEAARVYPYGNRIMKERKWTRVQTQTEAVAAVMSTFPDKTQATDAHDVKDLYTESFLSIPSKFPVYLITDEPETSLLFKAVSARFARYFCFGKIVKPSEEDINEIGIGGHDLPVPSLFVMVSLDGSLQTLNAVRFDESRYGSMNYTNIIKFLFAINSQYRHLLPGNNLADSQQEAEMSDIVKIEEKRFDIRFPSSNIVQPKREPVPIDLKPSVTTNIGKDEL